MSNRDKINSNTDVRDSDEKITIYLTDISSWIEVSAYHDKVFKFLRNSVDVFADIAEKCDCDNSEKICLLQDWVDTLKKVKDKRFWDLDDTEEDESD